MSEVWPSVTFPYCMHRGGLVWHGQYTTDESGEINGHAGAVSEWVCPECGSVVLCIVPDEVGGRDD